MATNLVLCGGCTSRQISKHAVVWCSDCSEGFCTECQDHHAHFRATKHHRTISINDYNKLPANILEISEYCSEHDEKYQLYCKKHDCPCCRRCHLKNHIECKEIVAIDDVLQNVKTSSTVLEIDECIADLLENIKRIRESKQKNLESLKNEKKKCQDEIASIRKTINDHLDKLQGELLKEVCVIEEAESKRIQHLFTSLAQNDTDLKNMQQTIQTLKSLASDLQIYLGMKQMEGDLEKQRESIQSIVKDANINNVKISYKIDDKLRDVCKSLRKFGSVTLENEFNEITLVSAKNKQAQIMIHNVSKPSIDHITLELEQTVNTGLFSIRGCALLPDGRMAFSSCNNYKVKVINNDGTKYFTLSMPHRTFDIEYIEQDNTLAVTSFSETNISIICMENKQIKKTINVGSPNGGIAVFDNALIYCAREKGIRKLNLCNEQINDIATGEVSAFSYVATFGSNIYYTNPAKKEVICCDFVDGTKRWKFGDKNVLEFPHGISLDKYGYVFVVVKKTVVVISPDGQCHRQLLSGSKSIENPNLQVLHYDRRSNKLLVINQSKTAFLYRVSYNI